MRIIEKLKADERLERQLNEEKENRHKRHGSEIVQMMNKNKEKRDKLHLEFLAEKQRQQEEIEGQR